MACIPPLPTLIIRKFRARKHFFCCTNRPMYALSSQHNRTGAVKFSPIIDIRAGNIYALMPPSLAGGCACTQSCQVIVILMREISLFRFDPCLCVHALASAHDTGWPRGATPSPARIRATGGTLGGD